MRLLFEIGHPWVGVIARVQARLERFEFDARAAAAWPVTDGSFIGVVLSVLAGASEFGTS